MHVAAHNFQPAASEDEVFIPPFLSVTEIGNAEAPAATGSDRLFSCAVSNDTGCGVPLAPLDHVHTSDQDS